MPKRISSAQFIAILMHQAGFS